MSEGKDDTSASIDAPASSSSATSAMVERPSSASSSSASSPRHAPFERQDSCTKRASIYWEISCTDAAAPPSASCASAHLAHTSKS